MGLLPGVDQEVFLEVSELREALVTRLAFEGSFSTVDTQVDLRNDEENR